jgi:exodeoxyribonuclease V alpha subunit
MKPPDRGPLIVEYLAREDRFRGIGSARASALWRRFGARLYELLDGSTVDELAEVVGVERAGILVRAWAEDRAAAAVVSWLDRHAFDRRLASKILRIWGAEAPRKIEENPYRMLAFAGWHCVDRAARALAVGREDPRRLVAAVEAVCYDDLDRKHTLLVVEPLLGAVRALLRCERSVAEQALRLAEHEGAVIRRGDCVQPFGPAMMERYVGERLASLARGEVNGQLRLPWASGGEEAFRTAAADFRTRAGHQLTDEQIDAAVRALCNPLFVISGGAGTGKTSVLECIHFLAERFGGRVIQMALAGRAAKRMEEATGRDAMTIAAFLHAVAKGNVKPDAGTVLAVDESSLLDLPVAYRLLRAARGARLVLLGDPGQLPPIGFGLVFHLLAGTRRVPRAVLTHVHRQAEETGIPAIAAAVREGRVPALAPFDSKAEGVSFVDCGSETVLETIVLLMVELGGLDGPQILAPTKEGPAGVRTINLALHALFCERHPRAVGSAPYRIGEPVMYLRNDYRGTNLRNGSLGRVSDTQPCSGLAVDFDEGRFVIAGDDLRYLTLAFAIGLHKAQGSQFDVCLVPVFPSRLLDRTLLYTAVTRGVRKVVLVGSRMAFREAVFRPPSNQLRRTGLEAYLTDQGADLIRA